MEHFQSVDVLTEIIKFINEMEDYVNLAQINKYFYENLLLNNNHFTNNKINELCKKIELNLNNNLPKYLLNLQHLNLFENINDQILNFTNLKSLTITNLPANFTFPYLPNLEELVFYNSILSLDCLSNLKHLQSLQFENSYFPENCLQELINLTSIKINKWKIINDFSIRRLHHLQQLQYLEIKESCTTEFILLKKLINLKHLILFQTVNYIHYSFLKYLINLETLTIEGGNRLEGDDLRNLKKLKKLKLTGPCNFDNNCFYEMTNLEELNCSLSSITDFNILKNLKIVKLRTPNVLEMNLQKVMNLVNIINLDIYWADRSFSGKCFVNCFSLKKLYISCCDNVKEEYLNSLNNLVELQLSCDMVTGMCFKYLNNLKKLILFGCKNLKEEYFVYLQKLKNLKIENCNEWFTGECLLHLRNLNNLEIPSANVLDTHLLNLLNLKKLNIHSCFQIKGDCLLNLNNLIELDISSTNIKDQHLKNLKKLKVLHAIKCNELSGEFLKQLKRLKIFNFEESFDGYGCNINPESSLKHIRALVENGKTLSDISNKKYEESSLSLFD
ncbi:hypothetical protein ABK040_005522 [Willaertia magna]